MTSFVFPSLRYACSVIFIVGTYVQPSSQFSVVPHFHVDSFVQTESDEIQRFLHRIRRRRLMNERRKLLSFLLSRVQSDNLGGCSNQWSISQFLLQIFMLLPENHVAFPTKPPAQRLVSATAFLRRKISSIIFLFVFSRTLLLQGATPLVTL